jgi:hypothetical protein
VKNKNIQQHIEYNSLLVSLGCIEWQRSLLSGYGYGQVYFLDKKWLVHRLVWTLKKGEIPEGLCVLHKCDNPKCCNIEHLFLGTHQDNMTDMVNKGRLAQRQKPLNKGLILKLVKNKFYTYKEIAEQFKCHIGSIRRIVKKNKIQKDLIC